MLWNRSTRVRVSPLGLERKAQYHSTDGRTEDKGGDFARISGRRDSPWSHGQWPGCGGVEYGSLHDGGMEYGSLHDGGGMEYGSLPDAVTQRPIEHEVKETCMSLGPIVYGQAVTLQRCRRTLSASNSLPFSIAREEAQSGELLPGPEFLQVLLQAVQQQ
ncbi:hypothetical protein E2P81_ATG11560 [Venturia nashicola]|nr:hypothetical protein E2P81_ATG11560 [Venturia nashicola]